MLYINPMASPYTARMNAAEAAVQRKEAAIEELEQLFVYMMLKEMHKTVPQDTLLGSPRESGIYEELRDDAYSKQIAGSGKLGIGEIISGQLRIQEMQADIHAQIAKRRLAGTPAAAAPSQ